MESIAKTKTKERRNVTLLRGIFVLHLLWVSPEFCWPIYYNTLPIRSEPFTNFSKSWSISNRHANRKPDRNGRNRTALDQGPHWTACFGPHYTGICLSRILDGGLMRYEKLEFNTVRFKCSPIRSKLGKSTKQITH